MVIFQKSPNAYRFELSRSPKGCVKLRSKAKFRAVNLTEDCCSVCQLPGHNPMKCETGSLNRTRSIGANNARKPNLMIENIKIVSLNVQHVQ